jgi:hypothetical protein
MMVSGSAIVGGLESFCSLYAHFKFVDDLTFTACIHTKHIDKKCFSIIPLAGFAALYYVPRGALRGRLAAQMCYGSEDSGAAACQTRGCFSSYSPRHRIFNWLLSV